MVTPVIHVSKGLVVLEAYGVSVIATHTLDGPNTEHQNVRADSSPQQGSMSVTPMGAQQPATKMDILTTIRLIRRTGLAAVATDQSLWRGMAIRRG